MHYTQKVSKIKMKNKGISIYSIFMGILNAQRGGLNANGPHRLRY